jgi:sorting nexin-4
MDDHGEGFDSVQWPRDPVPEEPQSHTQSSFSPSRNLPVRTDSQRRSATTSSEPQTGEDADAVDLAGIGVDGLLDCRVDTPLKENDGTKDAYVSYLVTTNVHTLLPRCNLPN